MIEPVTQDQMAASYTAAIKSHAMGLMTSPEEYAAAFAAKCEIPAFEFFGSTRVHEVAHPRQDCMREMKSLFKIGHIRIGRVFGRDHTTVGHGIKASMRRAAE